MEKEHLQQAEELNNNEPISPDTLNDETQEEVSVQGQPTPIEKVLFRFQLQSTYL